MIEIEVDVSDVALARFTSDAVWETTSSLNAVAYPREHILHQRLRTLLPRHPTFDLDHLFELTSNHYWIPDTLGPTPSMNPADPLAQFEALRETDAAVAAADIARLRHLRPEAGAARMQPAEFLDRTCTALAGYWKAVLAPRWELVQAIVDADIEYQRRTLSREGLAAAISGMHEEVSFAAQRIRINMRTRHIETKASGQGVWFVPSVFRWPWFSVDVREAAPVIYAARGAGRVWEEDQAADGDALAGLIGRSRAALLKELQVPRTTTVLAQRLGLSPGTVSEHLSVMVASGLLETRRDGRRVFYGRTAIGTLLVQGHSALERLG